MAAVLVLLLLSLLTLCFSDLAYSVTENEALLKLKQSFTHAESLDDWVSGSSPCLKRWAGVICFEGVVTGLHLSNLGLSGNIDIEALKELGGLRTISFVNNSFAGAIPEFNQLGALKSLLLSRNQFSGEILNDYFASMSSLKKVWLSNNEFTGKIPDSLMQLPHLIELHLEGNKFSGPIPPLKQPKLVKSLDLSHNNLEGKIPESYFGFAAVSFEGNDGLCGKPLDKDCAALQSSNQGQASSGSHPLVVFAGVTLALGAVLLLYSMWSARKRRKDDDFSMLARDSLSKPVMPIHSQPSSKKSSEASRKDGDHSSRRGSQHSRNGMGDLIMVNSEKGTFGLPDLMKAAAEVMGNGALGSAYKAMMTNGLCVVVKRIREMNVLGRDMFDAEMRKFGRIRHKNILTPLAYHFRKEEKLLVSEYVPKGSLLYVLHGDRGICHAGLNWETRVKIIKGIASGLGFLHSEYSSYNLAHGNLKSSNILLTEEYEPLLTDYALDPLTNRNHAIQAMFAYKSPEYIQYHQVSPQSDVYCLGIIILEIMTGKFPSQYLSNGKGGTDVVQWVLQASCEEREQEVVDPAIASNTNSLDQMVQMLTIGAACAESNPTQRLDLTEAIRRIEQIQV